MTATVLAKCLGVKDPDIEQMNRHVVPVLFGWGSSEPIGQVDSIYTDKDGNITAGYHLLPRKGQK